MSATDVVGTLFATSATDATAATRDRIVTGMIWKGSEVLPRSFLRAPSPSELSPTFSAEASTPLELTRDGTLHLLHALYKAIPLTDADARAFSFVDLGSGSGRVLLTAAYFCLNSPLTKSVFRASSATARFRGLEQLDERVAFSNELGGRVAKLIAEGHAPPPQIDFEKTDIERHSLRSYTDLILFGSTFTLPLLEYILRDQLLHPAARWRRLALCLPDTKEATALLDHDTFRVVGTEIIRAARPPEGYLFRLVARRLPLAIEGDLRSFPSNALSSSLALFQPLYVNLRTSPSASRPRTLRRIYACTLGVYLPSPSERPEVPSYSPFRPLSSLSRVPTLPMFKLESPLCADDEWSTFDALLDALPLHQMPIFCGVAIGDAPGVWDPATAAIRWKAEAPDGTCLDEFAPPAPHNAFVYWIVVMKHTKRIALALSDPHLTRLLTASAHRAAGCIETRLPLATSTSWRRDLPVLAFSLPSGEECAFPAFPPRLWQNCVRRQTTAGDHQFDLGVTGLRTFPIDSTRVLEAGNESTDAVTSASNAATSDPFSFPPPAELLIAASAQPDLPSLRTVLMRYGGPPHLVDPRPGNAPLPSTPVAGPSAAVVEARDRSARDVKVSASSSSRRRAKPTTVSAREPARRARARRSRPLRSTDRAAHDPDAKGDRDADEDEAEDDKRREQEDRDDPEYRPEAPGRPRSAERPGGEDEGDDSEGDSAEDDDEKRGHTSGDASSTRLLSGRKRKRAPPSKGNGKGRGKGNGKGKGKPSRGLASSGSNAAGDAASSRDDPLGPLLEIDDGALLSELREGADLSSPPAKRGRPVSNSAYEFKFRHKTREHWEHFLQTAVITESMRRFIGVGAKSTARGFSSHEKEIIALENARLFGARVLATNPAACIFDTWGWASMSDAARLSMAMAALESVREIFLGEGTQHADDAIENPPEEARAHAARAPPPSPLRDHPETTEEQRALDRMLHDVADGGDGASPRRESPPAVAETPLARGHRVSLQCPLPPPSSSYATSRLGAFF